jgi:hypothetical protein
VWRDGRCVLREDGSASLKGVDASFSARRKRHSIAALEKKYRALERENQQLETELHHAKSQVASVASLEHEYVHLTAENALLEAKLLSQSQPPVSAGSRFLSMQSASMLADADATNDLNKIATPWQPSGLTAAMSDGENLLQTYQSNVAIPEPPIVITHYSRSLT